MKRIVVIIGLVFCSAIAFAQDEEIEQKKGFSKDKMFIGGNFGLSFGDYTLINVSPQVGYRFNRFIAAGVGINGQYVSVKERDFSGNPFRKVSQGVVGLNIFGRVYPINNIMLQVQPELNYIFGKQRFYNPRQDFKIDAEIIPSLLVGGGAVLPSGGNNAFIIGVFYDVLQRENAPYGTQPFINFGYNIGLGR
jgi:hypothetical protein